MDIDYCKYHPLAPATYSCSNCDSHCCDDCVDEKGFNYIERCFACGSEVNSLGAANNAEPFWRRLDKSFKYPMTKHSMGLIIVLSIAVTFLEGSGGLLAFGAWLILTGVMVKYSFLCLQQTSNGLMIPPEVSSALGGGIKIMLGLIVVLFVMALAVYGCAIYIGVGLAKLLALVFMCGFPAVVINYAVSESLSTALNPAAMLRLMLSIGLPYGLLLALIMILSGSVGVINSLLGHDFSFASLALQNIASSYYTIVIFHIMGYMIFQYQERLGFSARGDFGETKDSRSSRQHLMARLSVLIKEGQYSTVLSLFKQGIKEHPKDPELLRYFFDFICATKNQDEIRQFTPLYVSFLQTQGRTEQIYQSYTKLLRMDKTFTPATPEAREIIADACLSAGNPKLSARALAGIHKAHPDYPELPRAFSLLARAFDEMPDMADKAKQCRKLVKHFEANPYQAPQNDVSASSSTESETPKQSKPISRFTLEEDNEENETQAEDKL